MLASNGMHAEATALGLVLWHLHELSTGLLLNCAGGQEAW